MLKTLITSIIFVCFALSGTTIYAGSSRNSSADGHPILESLPPAGDEEVSPPTPAIAPVSPNFSQQPEPKIDLFSTPASNITPTIPPRDTASNIDLWQRIRNGFALKELSGKQVKNFEKWYSNRPEYVQRMCERSQRYLYHIVEEVEKRGMPTEIALLPMIESAYNPMAYSHSHAVGIWQFIPSTAKLYGLERNWWYDGRRDILAATNSALDYLQYLHKLFGGDWQLALAAYNWGEGAVKRAMAKNRAKGKPTNYESLKIPKETRQYIPKLQAVKNIISNPAAYGLELPAVPNHPHFATISTTKHIDVKLAAQFADMSVEEFTSLNPAYNRPVILGKGTRTILLPVDKAEAFSAKFENHDKPLTNWGTYILKPKETLEDVADKFGITLTELRTTNGIHSSQKVNAGHALLVPATDDSDEESELNLAAFNNHSPDLPLTGNRTHYVKSGQTLYSIARQYRINVSQLKSWNRLTSNTIRPGQRLSIYGSSTKKVIARKKSKVKVAEKK